MFFCKYNEGGWLVRVVRGQHGAKTLEQQEAHSLKLTNRCDPSPAHWDRATPHGHVMQFVQKYCLNPVVYF